MFTHSKQTTTWQDKRIKAMNEVIKQNHYKTETLIEEYNKICASKSENKKQYKGENNDNS